MSFSRVQLAFAAGYTHSCVLKALLIPRLHFPGLRALTPDENALVGSCYVFLERLSL